MNFSYGDHIPIFISVHNKVEQLKQTIKSYEENINSPIKIVLFNHNTTYTPCINYLKKLQNDGYLVKTHWDSNPKFRKYGDYIRRSRNQNLIKFIIEYLQNNKNVNYVVVTDTDIELLPEGKDILDIYVKFYQKYKDINKIIGASLKLDDIPQKYPKLDRVLRIEKPNWQNKQIINLDNKDIICYKTGIDTTFKLFHRDWFNNSRKTLMTDNSYRTDFPYQVRHLDWYILPEDITKELQYYSKTSRNSHYRI